MIDWLSTLATLPAEYVKTAGTFAGGAVLAVGTYILARIREARRPVEAAPNLPRIALDPADRDLGFTLVRTATDLTRALNDHAEALSNLPGCGAPPAPPAPHHRNARNRGPQP